MLRIQNIYTNAAHTRLLQASRFLFKFVSFVQNRGRAGRPFNFLEEDSSFYLKFREKGRDLFDQSQSTQAITKYCFKI